MSKMKNLMRKLFAGITLKDCLKFVAIVSMITILLEALLVYSAYCFGAKCVDSMIYELFFALSRLVFMLYEAMFFFGGVLLIILASVKQRLASIRLFIMLFVGFIEVYAFCYPAEPVQFYSVKGFVSHVPDKIDIKAIQNWLDNAKLKKISYEFTCADDEKLPEKVVALHPRFWSIYNCSGKRAIEFSYGSHGTGTAFGILVIGENVPPVESMDMGLRIVNIKDVNDDCYLWSAMETETPVIAKILGLEIE